MGDLRGAGLLLRCLWSALVVHELLSIGFKLSFCFRWAVSILAHFQQLESVRGGEQPGRLGEDVRPSLVSEVSERNCTLCLVSVSRGPPSVLYLLQVEGWDF